MKKCVKIEGHYEKNVQKSKSTMQNRVKFSWGAVCKTAHFQEGIRKFFIQFENTMRSKKSACWNVDNL